MPNKFNPEKPNAGHRQRLRERFMLSRDSFQEYELLEMLLFLAFSRKDTKGLAKILLDKFKTLRNVVLADENQLRSIEGISDSTICLLKLFHEIHLRILKEEIKPEEIKLKNTKAVVDYFRSKLGNMVTEFVLVLFLNNSNEIVNEKIIASGDIDSVNVYKNMIITQATQNGSKSIIMVHNHPSGNARPSVNDIKLTRELMEVLKKVDITLLDHIIVSKKEHFSFIKSKILTA